MPRPFLRAVLPCKRYLKPYEGWFICPLICVRRVFRIVSLFYVMYSWMSFDGSHCAKLTKR
jgi:hypothetical protein